MLGLYGVKGSLDIGADADFVILSETETTEGKALVIQYPYSAANPLSYAKPLSISMARN